MILAFNILSQFAVYYFPIVLDACFDLNLIDFFVWSSWSLSRLVFVDDYL